jgi:hypothetical protein
MCQSLKNNILGVAAFGDDAMDESSDMSAFGASG